MLRRLYAQPVSRQLRITSLGLLSLVLSTGCGIRGLSMGSKSSAEASEATPPALLGTWKAGQDTLEFQKDGTLLTNDSPTTYRVVNHTILVNTDQGIVLHPFEVSGDQLVFSVEGAPVTYQRSSPPPAAAVAATNPTADGTAPAAASAPALATAAPAAALGGTAPGLAAALAGKWCYMSNVYASDGGRASSTCFVLNADGTYVYHSESSSSGQYGGTASQSDDSGTWQATETQLTARSSSGQVQTYELGRQNHPKNNDPMLLINGQAFVTYYQKPPW